MLFNSFEFILFFAVITLAYRLLGRKGQNLLLLGASYFFYGCWNWRFLLLLFASTVIDFYCGKKIEVAASSKHKRSWLILSLSANFGILGFFKYFNFFIGSLSGLLGSFGWHLDPFALKVILPVGVSFYTFQSISYIVDIYSNKIKPEKKFLDYALFVAFFPQLVAGPIERAGHMLPQYKTERKLTSLKNREGVWFIYWGFFLKVFMADNLARIVDLVFNQAGPVPGIEVALGSYAFAFQIFGDFAGYSFIAMGLARLLGFELMINFLFPYFVTNPRDFWKHWHISLSSWLRDYLYIPLGGNKKGTLNTYFYLFITMLLGGLWHGAAWTYVIWGIFQGLILIIHRVFRKKFPQKNDASSAPPLIVLIKVLFMFHVTCIGWLIFRANSFEQLSGFFHSLFFDLNARSDKAFYMAAQIVFYSALFLAVQIMQKSKNKLTCLLDLPGLSPWIIYGAMFYLIAVWGEFGGKPFIYFQF